MDPNLGRSSSLSRPGSIQLPSPPASPPFHPQQPTVSRSRSVRSQTSTSQSDPRYARVRPPLSSSQSTSTSLPFRPPAPHAPSSWAPSPSPAVSAHQPIPLAKAFRTDISQTPGVTHRPPPVTLSMSIPSPPPESSYAQLPTPPVTSRVRSGSSASALSPGIEARLATTRRSSVSGNPVPMGPRRMTVSGSGRDPETQSLHSVHVRMPDPTPHYQDLREATPTQSATSYHDPSRQHHVHGQLASARASSTSLAQSITTIEEQPSIHSRPPSIHNHPPPASAPPSRRGSVSSTNNISSIAGTPYVRRKDSSALRPLPPPSSFFAPPGAPSPSGSMISPLVYTRSPSHSRSNSRSQSTSAATGFPKISHSREGSSSSASTSTGSHGLWTLSRSRAGSMSSNIHLPSQISTALTDNISEEGSLEEEGSGSQGSGDKRSSRGSRRTSLRSVIPPLDPITPLTFDSLMLSDKASIRAESVRERSG
ncbi:hypothetical protein ABKN59_002849 [Abortiporus biennis]